MKVSVLRSLMVALSVNSLVWGVCLGSKLTLSPEGQLPGINPTCRVGTRQLACQAGLSRIAMEDAGALALQNVPADYFFRRARLRGEPRPEWNPYIGSGYPILLDGHNSAFAPSQWFVSRVIGDQGQDIVVFVRFALWTFAINWLAALWGATLLLQICVAFAATLAPYLAAYVDITFLDADLLSPWFLLILVGLVQDRLSLRTAAGLSFLLGVLVGCMSFPQAQVVVCIAMAVVALAAAPFTRGHSLLLAACLGLGNLGVVSSWLPLLRNLDQFVSSRSVQCIAEQSVGARAFLRHLLYRPLTANRFTFVTLVGVGLLPFVPQRVRFVVIALGVLGAWTVLGLPHAACALPVLSGARFVRHLVPHLEMLFIMACAAAIAVLSRRRNGRRAWILLAAAQALTLFAVASAHGRAADWALRVATLGTVCALMAGCLSFTRAAAIPGAHAVARATFEAAFALFAFTPFVFASALPLRLLDARLGAPQLPALPDTIDPTTPLGRVQTLSEQQDRRHYSPSGFLEPNWAEAIGIMDVLLVYAFYPIGYYELNATLFKHWYRDPQHGLIPDRFTSVPSPLAMSTEFQRVMAVNRVSLLTFSVGAAEFAGAPSPYQASKCRLLARSTLQETESYVCPEVGGVGYFPNSVRVVGSRAAALDQLSRLPVAAVLDTALLGPELDSSIGVSSALELSAAQGRVISVRRWGDDLTYQLEVAREGMFVIADTYFPGWSATVNGQRAGISRANVAFKAVRVPVGRVELKLHFAVVRF